MQQQSWFPWAFKVHRRCPAVFSCNYDVLSRLTPWKEHKGLSLFPVRISWRLSVLIEVHPCSAFLGPPYPFAASRFVFIGVDSLFVWRHQRPALCPPPFGPGVRSPEVRPLMPPDE